jgi:hypothetical protein
MGLYAMAGLAGVSWLAGHASGYAGLPSALAGEG